MKRLLESDDDQRVHEWSQYFENLVECLDVAEFFSKKTGQLRVGTDNNYKLSKTLSITFLSEWTAPCNAPPYIHDKFIVKMGYETFSMFNKFHKTFLMDLGDKLVSKMDRNDLRFTTRVASDMTLVIRSETKEYFHSRRKEENIGEFIPL